MIPRFKQFVPSQVCLSCDGCCRFKEETSAWRPKIGQEEVREGIKNGLAEGIFSEAVDLKTRHIKTMSCQDGYGCSFFNPTDNTCRIYQHRPFECQLYPFLLTKRDNRMAVAVHHLCPFIQEKYQTAEYTVYVDYLKEFFQHQEVLAFLKRHEAIGGDYSGYEDEVESLFDVGSLESIESVGSEPTRQRLRRLNDGSFLLENKAIIEKFLRRAHGYLSSHSFVNIFLWKDFFDYRLETIDGNLCVFATNETGCFLYLPPLGEKISPVAIEESFKRINSVNQGSGVSRIENVEQERFREFPPAGFLRVKKSEEFIYLREDIAAFRGSDYKSPRNACNHFIKNYRYAYRPFEASMIEDCLRLYDQWAGQRMATYADEVYRQMLEENHQVHKTALEYYQELNLMGRVVLVDGQIKGYTFGYRLNPEMFCVLLEITDLAVKGLSAFIFREFCRDQELRLFKWINAMDDFGLVNVRRTKMAFRPAKVVEVYVVKENRHKDTRHRFKQ